MRFVLASLILFSTSCGSVFIEYPPEPPDFEECTVGSKHFEITLKKTTIPVPFTSDKNFKLFTSKPEFWDQFNGTIHLKSIKWNTSWISYLVVMLDGLTIAVWDNDEWSLSSRKDLEPYFTEKEDDPEWLVFNTSVRGKGVKPPRRVTIEADIEFYFCGENHELMFDLE